MWNYSSETLASEAPINSWLRIRVEARLKILSETLQRFPLTNPSLQKLFLSHTRLQPPGSPHESSVPFLAIVSLRINRTNLDIGGPLANTLRVWSSYSNLFCREKETTKKKGESIDRIFLWDENRSHRRQIGKKLQKITKTIKDITERNQRYDIDPLEGTSSDDIQKWVKNQAESSLFIKEDELVGIEDKKQILMGWLMNGEQQQAVISVVGMGGSGKTTIVAKTFTNESVKRHFSCYAWIMVSQSYVIEDLFRSLIKEVHQATKEEVPAAADLNSMSYRKLLQILVTYLEFRRNILFMSLLDLDISFECTLEEFRAQILRERNIRLAVSTPLPISFSPFSSSPSSPIVESPPPSPMAAAAGNAELTMQEYSSLPAAGQPSCIVYPATTLENFELRSGMIHILPKFFGNPGENPNAHILDFEEVCSTIKIEGMSSEEIRVRLFSFSLKDTAKEWLHSLPPNSITTWTNLAAKFLQHFFPAQRTNELRSQITGILQRPGENFQDYWDRYKKLLITCPHHNVQAWLLMQNFYEGLFEPDQNNVNAATGGTIMVKTPTQVRAIFDLVAANARQYNSIVDG